MNFHNQHVSAALNTQAVAERGHQHCCSINLWIGVLGDKLLGPYILSQRIIGAHYHQFPVNVFSTLLENVPCQQRLQMWFMHDGAPAHFLRNVREHLMLAFQDRWIRRGVPSPWPPHTPDLTPLHIFGNGDT